MKIYVGCGQVKRDRRVAEIIEGLYAQTVTRAGGRPRCECGDCPACIPSRLGSLPGTT